jgi:hypothetical protein
MRRFYIGLTIALVSLTSVLLVACGTPPAPPTPTLLVELIATPSPEQTASPSASPAPTSEAQLVPPSITSSPLPPTESFTPSPTPGPVEYIIQPGDTLLFIIQQPPFNYRDLNVVSEILRLNPNIVSADRLPAPGSVILIPLPTPTPTPEGTSDSFVAEVLVVTLPVSTTIIQHTVREGETIIGIAEQYRATLRILSNLNPEVGFFNCEFDNPSGGPDCTVLLEVGQAINVPAPTPTPTLSPTPSGSETPTPTPTAAAPLVSFPPLDAVINATMPFTLQWVSVGILQPDQAYLVQIEDVTTGASYNDVTRANSYRIPSALMPTDGQTHQFRWRVSVAEPNAEGLYDYAGAQGDWRSFSWSAQ